MFLSLRSGNRKIGRCAATYLPFKTCPRSCPFLDGGCYAQGVLDVLRIVRNIGDQTKHLTPLELCRQEAEEIIEAAGSGKHEGVPLRLHVAGDVEGPEGARVLAEACEVWRESGGGPVWTYTHNWRKVPVGAWSPSISVWASVDNAPQGAEALDLGYAPALVVPYFDGRRSWDEAGVHWTACPAQARSLTCQRCRICWEGSKTVAARGGVSFEAHGGCIGKGKAIATARVLLGEQMTLFGDAVPE